MGSSLTAAQEILLAAAELSPDGPRDFTEWDLTVATWKRSKNRFGCRGYEELYPDHKRTMMEIMGTTKKDNPIRRGWMEKVRPNYYRITSLGLAEAGTLKSVVSSVTETKRSAQHLYDAIAPYMFHRTFLAYCKDPAEPRTWLGASAFFGITTYSSVAVIDRLRKAEDSIRQTLQWYEMEQTELLRRGPSGGRAAIKKRDVEKLAHYVDILKDRFEVQIRAASGKG
jgi:hypothetical protein